MNVPNTTIRFKLNVGHAYQYTVKTFKL